MTTLAGYRLKPTKTIELPEIFKKPIFPCAVILLAVSLLGIYTSGRAGLAFMIYHDTKFASDAESMTPREAAARCAKAFRLYPYNYHFCLWTALKGYRNLRDDKGLIIPENTAVWAEWCDRGYGLNPYMTELNVLKAELIARRSPADAIDFWKKYLEWHFWDPYNHAVMVGFLARAGDFTGAVREMRWVRGSRFYEEASGRLRNEWEKAKTPPTR